MEDIVIETEGNGQETKEEKMEEVEKGEVRERKSCEEEKKGGFINHLASLVLPLSPKSRIQVYDDEEDVKSETNQSQDEGKGEAVESTDDGGGGGIINSLISNFFHPNEGGEEEQKQTDNQKVETEATQTKEVKKEEGGGGLIDNLVSHLRTSLPDNAVPAADEAAILIHSIIHD